MGGKVLELESEKLIKKGQRTLIEAIIALRNGTSEKELIEKGYDAETIKQANLVK